MHQCVGVLLSRGVESSVFFSTLTPIPESTFTFFRQRLPTPESTFFWFDYDSRLWSRKLNFLSPTSESGAKVAMVSTPTPDSDFQVSVFFSIRTTGFKFFQHALIIIVLN